MAHDIGSLHHVGIVVDDMAAALACYRRLGFVLSPPAYPAMPRSPGEPSLPLGAANSHADFRRSFVELVTVATGDRPIPADARLVPLQVPSEAMPRALAAIEETVARLKARLDRFAGAHILVFEAPDVEAVAARFSRSGIAHGGVQTVVREVAPDGDRPPAPGRVRVLELDGAATPEGRIAVAEGLPDARPIDHPNGAVALVDVVLAVADGEVAAVQQRYEAYAARPALADGPARVVPLAGARVTILPASRLPETVPGALAPELPAFVAFAVAVDDLAATGRLLEENGLAVAAGAGGLVVPAAEAAGAAVIFRRSNRARGGRDRAGKLSP